jgi:hypothetical protein
VRLPRAVAWSAGWCVVLWRADWGGGRAAPPPPASLGRPPPPPPPVRSEPGEPLSQAMLLCNTHESAPAGPAPAPPPSAKDERMWRATGCSAPFAAVPASVRSFWAHDPTAAPGDMCAYCRVTLNGTATARQRQICGAVPSHRCTLQPAIAPTA